MVRIIFVLILIIHGLIHIFGFSKLLYKDKKGQLAQQVSHPVSTLLWLITTGLFVATAILFLINNNSWLIMLFISIIISQLLIFTAWEDAKYGTLLNLFFLSIAIITYQGQNFENTFRSDVQSSIQRTKGHYNSVLTDQDIAHLPKPVQKYLRYVGVVGQKRISSFEVELSGEMRNESEDWFPFTSQQYNFTDQPERFFFMKAKVKRLPTSGYHRYTSNEASMLIKLLSIFPVAKLDNDSRVFQAETVTYFNDMCLFAPSSLIDERIEWESIHPLQVRATFTNNQVSISAILHFNQEGQLVNFVSDDRFALTQNGLENHRFSTPISNYQNFNGFNLPSYGEAIWHFPDGDFVYGKMYINTIQYNIQ